MASNKQSPTSSRNEMIGVLQVACQSGRTDIIQAVIAELSRSGVRLQEVPQLLSVPRELDGATPLHIAALQGHVDACRALLRAGADVCVAGLQPPVQRKTPFEVAKTKECQQAFIMEAFGQVAAGNAGRVRELIDGGLPVGCSNGSPPHDTLLHWAACFGHEQVVEALVKLGACVNALNDEGVTPLHEASRNGQIRAAVHLLVHQADPTIKATAGPCEDKTPIEVAANHEMIELFKNIAEGDGSLALEEELTVTEEALLSPQGGESPSLSGSIVAAVTPEVRAMASVTDMSRDLPMLWPPPKSCLLQADSRGVSHAWITRTILLVPPQEEEEEQQEGVAVEVLRSALEAHGCRVLPVSWNQTPSSSPSEGAGGSSSSGTRPLLVTMVIKRALFSSSQAYHLLITPTRIEITASDAAGLLYGAYTLVDVIKWYGEVPAASSSRPRAFSFSSNNNNHNSSHNNNNTAQQQAPLVTNTDRLLTIPTLCIRDWPDFSSRAVLLSARHSPRLTVWAVKSLARTKINTIMLTLPTLPVAPSSRALAAARLLTLDRWCKRHHVDLVPTFLIDPSRLDALLLAPPSGPWLRGFSSRQLSVIISPAESPQDALSQARRAIEALEEALGPAGMLPGGWVVHVWGLPAPLAMDLAVSWLSRANRGLSVVAHGGGQMEATWGTGIEVGRALGRPAWLSTGLTGSWGPVLQLRRALLTMVQLAQASQSSSTGERPAGYLAFGIPFHNTLCPLFVTKLVGFVAAGTSWSAEGTAAAINPPEAISPTADKNAARPLGSLVKVFSSSIARCHSWRQATGGGSLSSELQHLSSFLEVLLTFSPSRPQDTGAPVAAGECSPERAEEALWSVALLQDLSLVNFHEGRPAWRDSLIALHRHLHSLSRSLRDLIPHDPAPPATPSVFSYAYYYVSPRKDTSSNANSPLLGGRQSQESFGSAFACQEARLITTFLRHLCRCLLSVLEKLRAEVKGDVRFSLANIYELDAKSSSNRSNRANTTVMGDNLVGDRLPSSARRQTSSDLYTPDWSVGPLLASPELLPQTQRCDVANGLLDLYQQSLRLSSVVATSSSGEQEAEDEDEEAWGGLREAAGTWSGRGKDEGSAQEPLAITRRTITQLLKGLNFDSLDNHHPSSNSTKQAGSGKNLLVV